VSPGECAFELHCRVEGLDFKREVALVDGRKWRWDFVIKDLAIEIQGGIWTGGGHSRGAGQEKDMRKLNAAVKAGFRVMQFSTQMVESGEAIADVLEALK
jgi:very-short-patch-repair endonuclease